MSVDNTRVEGPRGETIAGGGAQSQLEGSNRRLRKMLQAERGCRSTRRGAITGGGECDSRWRGAVAGGGGDRRQLECSRMMEGKDWRSMGAITDLGDIHRHTHTNMETHYRMGFPEHVLQHGNKHSFSSNSRLRFASHCTHSKYHRFTGNILDPRRDPLPRSSLAALTQHNT